MSTTNEINPMGIIRPAAEGVIVLAVISAMANSFGAMGMAAGMSSFSDPYEELKDLNRRVSRLSYAVEQQRESARGTRIHMAKLMQEYGLSIRPSIVEMKKYPKLRNTDHVLSQAVKKLDGMEVGLMNLQRKRRELQTRLHVRPDEEEGPRRAYPAMKQYVEPARRYDQ